MAYESKNLSALGYANGFTLWHYRTTDSAAAVDAEGYFSSASRMLRVGDFILVNSGVDTDAPKHSVVVVASNAPAPGLSDRRVITVNATAREH